MSFAAYFNALPPSLSLVGYTAIVTGSSSGIGRQTALHLARLGAAVLCADLQPAPRQERAAQEAPAAGAEAQDCYAIATHDIITRAGGTAQFVECNVTREQDWQRTIAAAVQLGGGRLDILVNNAGIAKFSGGILEESLEDYSIQMAVNVQGVFLGTKLALAQMVTQTPRALPADRELDLDELSPAELAGSGARLRPAYEQDKPTPATSGRLEGDAGARGSRGSIVNIASLHGFIGGPGEAAYGASKGAVVNLTRQVAGDYAGQRVQVNCVCPGYVDSAMTLNVPPALAAKRPTPWPHRGNGRDVAKSVIYFARDSPWSTGTVLLLDGGTSAR